MHSFNIKTRSHFDLIKITDKIKKIIREENVDDGLVTVYVPHTTAAVTINEGADPDVAEDIKQELDKIIPLQDGYSHREGNSAAHIKSSIIGTSENIIVENGSLVLGTWQAVFFCEFDGPRTRKVYVKVN